MTEDQKPGRLTRRQSFALAAASTASVATGVLAQPAAAATQPSLPHGACVVMPEDIEGPYYLDGSLHRVDITEGQAGIPMHVRIQLLGTDCRPLTQTRVDLWHTDNQGIYSGYKNQGDDDANPIDARGKTYLRGIQFTDDTGQVEFVSIYPGWYRGRTPHVHAKIYVGKRAVLNVQMYLPDALNEAVYTKAAVYHRAVARDTLNYNDHFVLPHRPGFFDIKEMADHYQASIVIAVDPTHTAERRAPPPDMKLHPRMDATPALPPEEHARRLFPSA